MMYDVFSSRSKFKFDWIYKFMLYNNFLLPLLKCFHLKCCRRMKHKMKMYEAAEDKYYKDLDICNVMDVIRSSMNFLSNFMTRE